MLSSASTIDSCRRMEVELGWNSIYQCLSGRHWGNLRSQIWPKRIYICRARNEPSLFKVDNICFVATKEIPCTSPICGRDIPPTSTHPFAVKWVAWILVGSYIIIGKPRTVPVFWKIQAKRIDSIRANSKTQQQLTKVIFIRSQSVHSSYTVIWKLHITWSGQLLQILLYTSSDTSDLIYKWKYNAFAKIWQVESEP